MASLLTHFPNRSDIESRRETYNIDPRDKSELSPSDREREREVTSGVRPASRLHSGTACRSSDAMLGCPSIDSELPARLVMQDGSQREKRQPLRSRSAKGWKRTSSFPLAARAKVSSQIQQILRFKSSPKLQLPSFELLGIANPHPDTFSSSRPSTASLGGRWPPDRQRRDTELEATQLPDLIVEGQTTPGHETVALLTPPDEHTSLEWVSPIDEDFSDDVASTHMTDLHAATMDFETLSITGATSVAGEGTTTSAMPTEVPREGTSGEGNDSAQPSGSQAAEICGSESGQAWLEQAIAVALSGIRTSGSAGDAVKFLSHAMPWPASGSNESATTAFLTVISALREKIYSGHVQYILVTHAVPLRFNLADLPTSPPSTPNPTVPGGSDYFSIFANAVAVVDRHGQAALNTPVPSSPCPIVPPSSVEISLLERYIPPSTMEEYFDLFSATDPSALVDRLVELKPNGGAMVFIYPTKAGAEAFAKNYLGPILDPLLRTIVVLHKLSADIGIDIGRMATVEHLATFEGTKRKLNILFTKLSRGTSLQTTGPQMKLSYSLVHSCKGKMQMDRKVWSEWWAQQEIPRVREVVARYFKRAQHLPANPDVTSAVLVREIVGGVATRPYSKGTAPTEGIEVGVFVIRRTA